MKRELIGSLPFQDTVDALVLLLDRVLTLVYLFTRFATGAGNRWFCLVVELVAQGAALVLTACHGHDLVLGAVLLEVALLRRADAFLWVGQEIALGPAVGVELGGSVVEGAASAQKVVMGLFLKVFNL